MGNGKWNGEAFILLSFSIKNHMNMFWGDIQYFTSDSENTPVVSMNVIRVIIFKEYNFIL